MLYPYRCDNCGSGYEVSLTVQEYENYKPYPCENCGEPVRREWTVPSVSWFCGRTLYPEDWNYNKKTGEVEDGHAKTLRKQREGVDVDTL